MQMNQKSRGPRRYHVLLAAVAVAASSNRGVEAASKFYVGSGGLWSDGPWSLSSGGPANTTPPTTNDDAFFDAAASYTVTRNNISAATTYRIFAVDGQAADPIIVQFAADSQTNSFTQFVVGSMGRGQVDVNTGTIGSTSMILDVGNTVSGSGTVTVASGGTLLFGSAIIGDTGNGTLVQSGGQVTAAGPVTIGAGATGLGYVEVNGGTYSVSVANPATSINHGQFNVNSGVVRLAALQVGTSGNAGADASLTLNAGSLSMGFTQLGNLNGNTVGGMVASGGTISFTGGLTVNPGSYFLNQGAVLGYGAASLNITRGTVDFGPASTFVVTTTTPINLTDGTVSAGNFINGGSTINFGSGTVNFTNSNFDASTNSALGSGGINLTTGKALVVNLNTNLKLAAPITISGGTFSTGGLTGDPAGLNFVAGTFRLTNTPLYFGPGGFFGSSYTVDQYHRLETGSATYAIIDTGAQLAINGGAVDAAGAVINSGLLQLTSLTSRVGSFVDNYALLSGTGRVTGTLYNEAPAETRVGATDWLRVEGDVENFGLVNLLGGVFDVTGTLHNNSGSRITGRGTIMSAALVNEGTIQLSSQLTDVHGSFSQAPPAKIIIAGNSTVNFYDPMTNAGEVRVAAGSTAVFFGAVTNTGSFSGGGVKDFEDLADAGPIATPGSTVVGPEGNVTAAQVRESALSVEGLLTISSNGTSSGVSRVGSLNVSGGKINLSNNALIVDYSTSTPLTNVRDLILQGRAGGSWAGDGITSSLANTSNFGIGFGEASAVFSSFDASFLGQTVDNTTVLIRFTDYGDANLDGIVNTADFTALANHFGETTLLWTSGDFNYDGIVNALDFNSLASNFGQPISGESLRAVVPEPTMLLPLALLAVLARRRWSHATEPPCSR